MRFRSLSFKLTIWYTIILAFIISLAGIFLYERFKDGLMDDLEERLLGIAVATHRAWLKRGVTWQEAVQKTEKKYKMYQPFIQVVKVPNEEKKETTWEYFTSHNVLSEFFKVKEKCYHNARTRGRSRPQTMTLRPTQITTSPLRTILYLARNFVVVQVGLPMDSTIDALSRLLIMLFLAGPLLLLLAAIGGHFIIRRALQPVMSVVQTAQNITAEDLSMRIESGERRDEIGQLVATFNQMITRLEGSVQKILQFSGDVSHELRTPLTIIRGEIEVILRKDRQKKEYREILSSILEETQQMENIINDLLLLSKVRSANKKMVMETYALDKQLHKVVGSFASAAAGKQIKISIEELPRVIVTGKKTLIERMITNIIDNAIRYTTAGGSINVSLFKVESFAELTITDTGVGIPEAAIPAIFDRFYVVDKSRSKENGGTGLGLSIVKWIADNHNIQIQVNSKPDEGTAFKFLFPLS